MFPMWLAVTSGALLVETGLVVAAAVYVYRQGASEREENEV